MTLKAPAVGLLRYNRNIETQKKVSRNCFTEGQKMKTVEIPNDTHKLLKIRAIHLQRPLKEVCNQILRDGLQKPHEHKKSA